jgi:hypothetical protein
MRAREKFIIRRVGNLTCHQLRENIRCDLKDLVAYTYATALDGSPSIRERLRIGIIRFVCPMHIEGQQHRRAAQFLYCSKRGLSSDSLHVLVAYEDNTIIYLIWQNEPNWIVREHRRRCISAVFSAGDPPIPSSIMTI